MRTQLASVISSVAGSNSVGRERINVNEGRGEEHK